MSGRRAARDAALGAARLRVSRGRRLVIVLALAVAVLVPACGKKGPPLAPLVRIPALVEPVEVRRVGQDVYVTVALPAQNVDGSTPADVSRVELYAVTSRTAPPRDRFLEQAMRVDIVRLERAPGDTLGEPPPPPGGSLTFRERLTEAALEPVADGPDTSSAGSPEPAWHRFYAVTAYGARGVSAGPGPLMALPLAAPPPPPQTLSATYDAEQVVLTWTAVAPVEAGAPVAYNVYRVIDAAELPAEESAAPAVPPVPLNAEPLARPGFAERVALDGLERCYAVRTVRPGEPLIEGEPSARACTTLVDRFPPAAPRSLSAVALEGAVSLIWLPNDEPDLAGYVILRGAPGDATLTPLMNEPMRVTQFVDRTVVAGRPYVYAVVAVDDQAPPNVSEQSNRVEATPR